ncbi:acetate/propionate family kinase [Patescibacteria group bacterium]|nr:acetate/propionate family kinase [Patescibacteria group bacterium]MBU4512151.1 acetate/propionate family kinase [Patescibacteria group bacterium]MCG2693046.1 acetate/propionate family kinase [Candidatus Parcubacteria bacterium]
MPSSILVINTGSTSLKYKLFDLESFRVLALNDFAGVENHDEAIKQALREIGNLSTLVAIGHRVVHGGAEFSEPTEIIKDNIGRLEAYNKLAPLHNPYNIAGIRACLEYLPGIPNIAVFDTAFFKDLPDKAKIYAIPFEFYKEHGIQRFGFHGISHKFVAQQAAEKLGKPLSKINLITCHLGGGASITAIRQGKPVDTSMGYTPLEGLVMMTRPGDIDAGIVLHLKNSMNGNDKGMVSGLLNRTSGIKGICGIGDYLDLLEAVKRKDSRALLAFNIFVYRIQKYLGAYLAILGGVDAIVFTGKIGAGKPITKEKITKNLKVLRGVKILVIPSDEELMIAREVSEALKTGSDES